MKVIAHRGASVAERENTVAAFAAAVEMGADMVELDARRSSDGVIVVHHDAALGDGRTIVACAAGDLPEWLPTLDAALRACDPLTVNIEIKNIPGDPDFDPSEGVIGEVAAMLESQAYPPSLISSFHPPTVDRARELGLRSALLVHPLVDQSEGLAAAIAGGHDAWHPYFAVIDAELVAAAHAAGLAVNVWTCDEPEWMKRLRDWGVDGLCTNVPDVARAVLR